MTDDVKQALSPAKNGLTLIITVGNSLRGDDGVGPYIKSKILIPKSETNTKLQNPNIHIIDAGERPENIIDEAIALKPSKVVIIDSANFSGLPGEARIIPEEHINNSTLSTHLFPLGAISKLIREDTGAEVLFLGIQQKNIGLGEEMSEKVKEIAEEISACVMRSPGK